jgi:hypothetical protein
VTGDSEPSKGPAFLHGRLAPILILGPLLLLVVALIVANVAKGQASRDAIEGRDARQQAEYAAMARERAAAADREQARRSASMQ